MLSMRLTFKHQSIPWIEDVTDVRGVIVIESSIHVRKGNSALPVVLMPTST